MDNLQERIEKALTMTMISDCPPFSQLLPEGCPVKAVPGLPPEEMQQLISDMQARIVELQVEKPIYQVDENGDISIAKCKNCTSKDVSCENRVFL